MPADKPSYGLSLFQLDFFGIDRYVWGTGTIDPWKADEGNGRLVRLVRARLVCGLWRDVEPFVQSLGLNYNWRANPRANLRANLKKNRKNKLLIF